LALALAEREEISRGVMARLSARTIARTLARAPCTVSREIRRNGGSRGVPGERGRRGGVAPGDAAEAL